MHEQCRNDLDYGEDAYLEHDLLDQIIVFKERIRPARDRLRKIKSRNDPHNEPEDIRKFHITLDIRGPVRHYHTENEPIQEDGYDRGNKAPEHAKIGARVFSLKIILGKLPDKLPVLVQFLRKDDYPVIHLNKD